MLASELIAELTALIAEHGDLPVRIREVDPYTGSDDEAEDLDIRIFDEVRISGGRTIPKRFVIDAS